MPIGVFLRELCGLRDHRDGSSTGIHDDIFYGSQIAVQDPKLGRMEQRLIAGLSSWHGAELMPIHRTIESGRKFAAYRAGITARGFQTSQQRLRPK